MDQCFRDLAEQIDYLMNLKITAHETIMNIFSNETIS